MGKGKSPFAASSKTLDPTLSALFASSSGPVKAPSKSRYSAPVEPIPRPAPEQQAGDEDDEELSEASEELDYDDNDEGQNEGPSTSNDSSDAGDDSDSSGTSSEGSENEVEAKVDVEMVNGAAEPEQPQRDRKRKRKDEHEDLEDKYLAKLAEEDAPERSEKRVKAGVNGGADAEDEDEEDFVPPKHETLTKTSSEASELEKAARTVFLSNVCSEAISSKVAKKTLIKHLSSVLDSDTSPPEKVESIRFRSVALSTGSMPKRAAVITKQLMAATTKSTNAYAVFSTTAAARKAAQLNATEVLGRHLRVDSVTHPSPMDHRRCVFVGNLGFVDDETVLATGEDGETTQKKRNKTPSDIEEGLWRTFGKQGKVESVRVVRDPKTRVGKGFAYVQFYDANSVESAVLLDGKKFPPMLPRSLRVQRATHPKRTALAQERVREKLQRADGPSRKTTKYTHKATPEEKSLAGRASKMLGRSAAASRHRGGRFAKGAEGESKQGGSAGGILGPENFVFEGKRASSKDGRPKELKLGKKGKGKATKPQGRGARRASEWRKKSSV